jgi:hypothetical protein
MVAEVVLIPERPLAIGAIDMYVAIMLLEFLSSIK